MNTTAFHDALTSAKLLLVLGSSPFAASRKEAQKSINRIRAGVDLALVGLLLRDSAHAASDKLLEAHLSSVRKHLGDVLSKLHPSAFVLGQSHRALLFRAGVSNITSTLGAQKFVLDLLKGIEAMTPRSAKTDLALADAGRHPARAGTLKDFRSLVHNAEWLSMLAAVGVDPTGADAQKQVEHLTVTHGSRMGKTQVAARTARFTGVIPVTPAATAPARKRASRATAKSATAAAPAAAPAALARPTVGEFAVVVVKLDATKLLTHNRVRELSVDFPEVNPRITDLLSAAAFPVELREGLDAAAVAQTKLDEFFAGLDKREAAVKDARKAAEKAQKDKAVDALKGISPQLLAVLKRNPELLQKA